MHVCIYVKDIFHSLLVSLKCYEDFSSFSRDTVYVLLYNQKNRALISGMFHTRTSLSLAQTEDVRTLPWVQEEILNTFR